jgi:putative transposase
MMRRAWIGSGDDVAVVRQCELAGVSRAMVYAQKILRPVDELDLLISRLIDEREKIVISMDGRGRVFDNIFVERLWRNVKYEDVYLKGYATIGELMVGLTKYFVFYNGERPHQALGNKTPDEAYRTAQGGGAIIIDKFLRAAEEPPVPLRSTDDSSAAETESTATATTKAKAIPGQRRPAASAIRCTA